MKFSDFLEWQILNNPPRLFDFVTDPNNGQVLVDYIGRFETLEKDINILQERFGYNFDGFNDIIPIMQ
tara:strand:- start:903 stop:1106 length:204 start_codon:yes stop_codon:yes gene_type:complete